MPLDGVEQGWVVAQSQIPVIAVTVEALLN
jgi:hypothetical protein